MGAFVSRVQALFAPVEPPSPADLVTSHFCAPATLATVRAVFFAWHFTILLCLIIPPNRLALPQFCYLTIQSYTLIIIYCLIGALQYWRHRHVLDAIAAGAGRPLQPVETSGRYPPPVHPSLRTAHYSFPSFSHDSPTLPSVVAIVAPDTPMQLPPSQMAGTAASSNASSSEQQPSSMTKLDWIDNVHWILFQVLSTVAPFVTLVYWTLIYPKVCVGLNESRAFLDFILINSFSMDLSCVRLSLTCAGNQRALVGRHACARVELVHHALGSLPQSHVARAAPPRLGGRLWRVLCRLWRVGALAVQ
jgi:hypothetical protein